MNSTFDQASWQNTPDSVIQPEEEDQQDVPHFGESQELAKGFEIRPIVNGILHASQEQKRNFKSLDQLFNVGRTTFDLAAGYPPGEELYGSYAMHLRRDKQRGERHAARLQALTRWGPKDLGPWAFTRRAVEEVVVESQMLQSHMLEPLDMMQLHWRDYSQRTHWDALHRLCDMRELGRIRSVGLCNFDTEHLDQIADRGLGVVSNQVLMSVVDRRALRFMADVCLETNTKLLAYGVLMGGLLSERWLGVGEPGLHHRGPQLDHTSQQQYKDVIDAWGGWVLFQRLLKVCKQIADKHDVTIAMVAERWVLQQRAVASAVMGTRVGMSEHPVSTEILLSVELDAADLGMLDEIHDESISLFDVFGDCGDELRRRL
eukprot:CAMPEP_0114303312 /NCGR_PEP_ID=MMETSP0059-20121206/15145_1 /TAXON_ID=36894 /ORGANISM="Pyramimonas parkeae, Strain CCMP726" /LENGTH=373 /DNA_ID=CAMNT_0001426253 /DNA_START=63 /DNA_END=1184 /DNA_ORIENTATION=+